MPACKISKSRKHSKRSSKRSRASKLRSRKSQRGGGHYEFSNDRGSWFPANNNQIDAMNEAIRSDQPVYQYNKNGYIFTLTRLPNESDGNKITYQMTRENGSIAFLRWIMYQNELKKAYRDRLLGPVG